MKPKQNDQVERVEEMKLPQRTFAMFPIYDHSGQPTTKEDALQRGYEAFIDHKAHPPSPEKKPRGRGR